VARGEEGPPSWLMWAAGEIRADSQGLPADVSVEIRVMDSGGEFMIGSAGASSSFKSRLRSETYVCTWTESAGSLGNTS
jgi:hypothetical protein